MTKDEFLKLPEITEDLLKNAKVGDIVKARIYNRWYIMEVKEYPGNESHCRECTFGAGGGCGLCDCTCYYHYRPDHTDVWFKTIDMGFI